MTELYREKPRRRGRRLLLAIAVVAVAFAALVTFRTGPAPEIRIEPALPGIGPRTPVRIELAEPVRGLGDLRVELAQGERVTVLAEKSHRPRPAWAFWGPRTAGETIDLEVGAETVDGLREGEATLRAVAARAGTWLLRRPPVIAERTLPVRLTPPRLEVLSTQHYPAQGGAEAVVYRRGETAVDDGVRVGERWFPGYPLPGGEAGERFSLFGVPFDAEDASGIRLEAVDELGNRARLAFVDRFLARPHTSEDIEISTGFMETVVPEILAHSPEVEEGDGVLQTYLAINGELRRHNAATLERLAGSSEPGFPWRRPFAAMPGAQVMSSFADRRTYYFDGREVDRQDHLGFDLASVRRARVPAANDGTVVLARYFGIYGNAVVVDHGYGLMSLYGHLSSIAVAEGERVARGQEIGRTGETGLAAGDHLHFTVLLHGLPVSPLEWWDGGWIRDRIARKLGDALPFEP